MWVELVLYESLLGRNTSSTIQHCTLTYYDGSIHLQRLNIAIISTIKSAFERYSRKSENQVEAKTKLTVGYSRINKHHLMNGKSLIRENTEFQYKA